MALAVSPWTGNGHEVGQQFADDSFVFFVGGFTEDMGEDRMRHLCLNAFLQTRHWKSSLRRYKKRKGEVSGMYQ